MSPIQNILHSLSIFIELGRKKNGVPWYKTTEV